MLESTQQRAEKVTSPLSSAVGDVRRAKSSGSASVQELREFLQSHRGKSSQELLGELGKSSLLQAMVKSTLGCLALMAVLTVVPFYTEGPPQPKKSKSGQKAAAPANAAATPATNAAPKNDAATTTNSGLPDGVDLDKAKKTLGLDETKSAPANVNPREKDLDNLLDGVK
jgi:hypothetical protein